MSVAAVEKRSSFARVPAAFRLSFIVPSALIWIPLIVFAGSWALAIGIGLWVDYLSDTAPGEQARYYTGASQASLWTLAFMAGYVATHTLPFSMALSYSRRVFVLGSFLAFAAVSAGFGLAFSLAATVERVTDGFGFEGYTFDLPFLTQGPGGIPAAGLLAAVICLGVMMFGFGIAILFKRFGLARLWMILLGGVVLMAVAAMVVTTNNGWPTVWSWIIDQTALSLAGWLVLPVAGLTVLNYVVARKTTP